MFKSIDAMKSIKNEENIIRIFENTPVFNYNNREYRLLVCGKPRVQNGNGEPKTDIYARYIVDEKDIVEVKISLKQTDYNFLENKIGLERFETIVGKGNGKKWATIIAEEVLKQDGAGMLKSAEPEYGVVRRSGETPCTRYLLGYRLDITNKPNGKRSFPLNLTLDEKKEVFTGATLEERKRNAVVNGQIIDNSGIANLLLEMDVNGTETPQDILDRCRTFDDDSFYAGFELYIYQTRHS